jgi:hypothetical protein
MGILHGKRQAEKSADVFYEEEMPEPSLCTSL